VNAKTYPIIQYCPDHVDGSKYRLSVVIPVYNEVDNLTELYDRLKVVLESLRISWELIFVDDGSRDGSLQLMSSICDGDSRVKVIKLRRNFGQTAALSAGFDLAQGDVIVTLDGDLQNDPADIPRLLDKLDEGYDIVSGWRKRRKDATVRVIPSHVANRLISFLTGLHLHDSGCTLKVYRRAVLHNIRLYGESHRFIPALATITGATVAELEVEHHPRKYGKSKYGFARVFRVFLDLLTLKLMLAYHGRPMLVFGSIGFLLWGLGIALGLSAGLMKFLVGWDITGNPLLYMSLLTIISGTQLIGLGFLGEINIRTYYESQAKTTYIIQEVLSKHSNQREMSKTSPIGL
jgi:glycosyltransferase involved in cell wall biosynthesis